MNRLLPFLALVFAAGSAAPASAGPGPGSDHESGEDRSARAIEVADHAHGNVDQTARDLTRALDRAVDERLKVAADAARDQQRFDAERLKILAQAAADPVKAQQDLAKLEADRAKWAEQRTIEYAKIESDLSREQAKIGGEYDRALDPVTDGASGDLRSLASNESPDFDRAGFPVRRGEVEALDLTGDGLARAKAAGFRQVEHVVLRRLGRSIDRLAVPTGMSLDQALGILRSVHDSAAVDLGHYYGMQLAGEEAESAPPAAHLKERSGEARAGMIDTGVTAHAALGSARIERRTFGTGTRAAVEHGTAVASILASEGTRQLLVADIFRADPVGHSYTSADAVAAALDWLARKDVPVINMSLAGPRNAILDSMIIRTLRNGIGVVAAAGNGGPTAPPAYPAALSPVVAVTAVDEQLHVYRYANRGPYITVAAPGVRELAARAAGGLGYFSGTSFAAPHATAWMARCLGNRTAGLRRIADCRAQMIHSARDLGEPGPDSTYGNGLIQ